MNPKERGFWVGCVIFLVVANWATYFLQRARTEEWQDMTIWLVQNPREIAPIRSKLYTLQQHQ